MMKWFLITVFRCVCYVSDPKCYNPRVLKSLCHEKRNRSETAKQFFRSSAATHFNKAQHVDSPTNAEQQSVDDQPCNGDHDNHHQHPHDQQQQQQQQQQRE